MSAPGFFDARALLDPIDLAAAARYGRAQRAADPTSGGRIAAIVIAIAFMVLLVVPVIVLVLVGIGFAVGGGLGMIGGVVLALLVLAGIGVGVYFLIRHATTVRDQTMYRLAGFAGANAMTYLPTVIEPPLPGMIFHTGTGRRATDVVRGTAPRFVEFGNYQYTTSNGKNSQTHHWGYVAVKLDVPLPNIVLDALGDNALGAGVGFAFRPDQRLSLEGDFDRYFALYSPAGYEADALYLFTPDVMARFIDHVAQLDVEIVDDWMFFYTRRPVSTLDPATWAWLFGAVGAVLSKLDQWARWRDDRLRLEAPASAVPLPFGSPPAAMIAPPPGVALPGRRLRKRSPWLVIVIVLGALALFTLLPFAIGVVVMLSSL